MKVMKLVLLVAGCLAALSMGVNNVAAQNGGGGPGGGMQQFRQRRIDGMREAMDVKDDAEWKVISDALGKVMDAQMNAMASRFGGGFGGRRRGGDQASADNGGDQNGGRRRFGPQPSAEAEALQKAIDAKAPADEIKTKLAALREANKANETKLEEAQADLKKLLTSRQEAVAVLNGLLK